MCSVCRRLFAAPNRIFCRRLFDCHRPSAVSLDMHTIPTTSDCASNGPPKCSVIGPIGHPISAPAATATSGRIGPADGTAGDENDDALAAKRFPTPPARDLCCGSGCPNCVWIQFAEEVMEYVKSLPLHDGVESEQRKMVGDALKQNVEDDNLRAYLQMEIGAKGF